MFEELSIVRSVARDAYMGSDIVNKLYIYLLDIFCAHAMMSQYVKYKFYKHPYMSAAITIF